MRSRIHPRHSQSVFYVFLIHRCIVESMWMFCFWRFNVHGPLSQLRCDCIVCKMHGVILYQSVILLTLDMHASDVITICWLWKCFICFFDFFLDLPHTLFEGFEYRRVWYTAWWSFEWIIYACLKLVGEWYDIRIRLLRHVRCTQWTLIYKHVVVPSPFPTCTFAWSQPVPSPFPACTFACS